MKVQTISSTGKPISIEYRRGSVQVTTKGRSYELTALDLITVTLRGNRVSALRVPMGYISLGRPDDVVPFLRAVQNLRSKTRKPQCQENTHD